LIQHIKELFSHNNVTICHTLRGKPMRKFLS
jgi:hypothetical protein